MISFITTYKSPSSTSSPPIKMDSLPSSNLLFFSFLLSSIFFACSSGSFVYDVKDSMQKSGKRAHPHRKELIQTTQHDFTNPPFTTYPATPVTNPVTTPATGTGTAASTPPVITVPSPDPTASTPIPPAVDPLNPPVPVTNPVTTPSTSFPPATTYPTTPAVTSPMVAPPAGGGSAPAVPGQSWCVARGGLPETVIQVALDYACGIGGADCTPIQQGQSCYNPNSLQNHASYAFNSYFQKNPVQTSCDFGGAAMITNVNPSSGSCIFGTWSSTSGSPATMSPTTTNPMPTPSIYGAAPAAGSGTPLMNASNPALGGGATGFGEIPPTTATSTSSGAVSSSLKPFVSCIAVAVSIVIGSSYRTLIYS